MDTKLFSVKAFQWEEKQDLRVMTLNEEGEDTSPQAKLTHYIRRLVIVAKNVSFQEAKKIRKSFEEKKIQAYIFPGKPEIKEEELKVIKL